MATRTGVMVICYLFLGFTSLFSQDEIAEVIDQAKILYLQENYQESTEQLSKALQMVHNKLLSELKAAFPDAHSGWRANDATGSISGMSALIGLNTKRSYFKQGGGPSIDIEMVTNSIKIANIKAVFSSPSMINRVGDHIEINTVADRKCLERYDPIDRYAELIFVPTSTLMITIIGHDIKNTEVVQKYAEKIKWIELEEKFP